MGIFILWLISLFISIVILYWIIISAINSSDMARDIKELKQLLMNQYSPEKHNGSAKPEVHEQISNRSSDEGVQEECPACGGKVLSIDEVCSSCGLTLIDSN